MVFRLGIGCHARRQSKFLPEQDDFVWKGGGGRGQYSRRCNNKTMAQRASFLLVIMKKLTKLIAHAALGDHVPRQAGGLLQITARS